MKFIDFKNIWVRLAIIVIIAAITWSSSITNEFVGYDDIKLIIRNERVQKDLAYTLNFYWNIVSDSHNVAWTNYPTVIYRPLEWFGSAVGYKIWGPRSWAYHLFVNFSFHILNSILLFFIISKIFYTPIKGTEDPAIEIVSSPKALTKTKGKKSKSSTKTFTQNTNKLENLHRVSWWLPFVIILLWVIHPLHNEAVNMLTSGVGFLSATLFCLTGFTIFLYVQDLHKLKNIGLLVLASALMFIGYHGSEMTVIAPWVLVVVFARSILGRDIKSYKHELFKIILAFASSISYLSHRSFIVSEDKEWMAGGLNNFFERLFVVAPEILFHYVKLFFFPIKLTVDQHHNVVLENAYTPYHLLCFAVALAFVLGFFYFMFLKEPDYDLHNKLIAGSIFFTGFSIAISLNIIPLYVLARDRYTYFFCLGMYCVIFLIADKYWFSKDSIKEKLFNNINNLRTILITILCILVVAYGTRSFIKSFDWRNGEAFWSSTIDSVSDLGSKQNWRYRLLQYYQDPGTTTFVANQFIKEKAQKDFNEFPFIYNLLNNQTINFYLKEAANPDHYLLNKYSYIGNKAIASALFFNATEALTTSQFDLAMNLFKASHLYYPEHFQTNLQMLIHTYGQDEKFTNYLLSKMEKDAYSNSFLAKGLMDGLFYIKHPRTYQYARLYAQRFPNTQVFNVYLFHASLMVKDYPTAYAAAKEVTKKYVEQDTFSDFMRQYEAANGISKP